MQRRKITMQPLGATKPFRPSRVGSSTCPKPQLSTDNIQLGLVDFSKGAVSGQDLFMANCAQDWSDAELQANPAIFDYFE